MGEDERKNISGTTEVMPLEKDYFRVLKKAFVEVPVVVENEAPVQAATPFSVSLRDRVNLTLSLEVRLKTAFLGKNFP